MKKTLSFRIAMFQLLQIVETGNHSLSIYMYSNVDKIYFRDGAVDTEHYRVCVHGSDMS